AATIVSGQRWTDTSGKYIQAHGGGVLKVQDTYYWVGEDKSDDSGTFQGFHMYSSLDLAAWKDEGLVLPPSNKTTSVGERPKILYNASTKKYVLWFHAEDSGYALAQVGVAVSNQVTGPYEFQGAFRPLGQESRDMSVYVDPKDQAAYLIFATNDNKDLAIASLSADYLKPDKLEYTIANQRYEGSGMFSKDNKYWLILSHQSSWEPNDNMALVADSPKGPFDSPTGIAPANLKTYNSQNHFDLVIRGSEQTCNIYMGDRWRSDKLGQSTEVWQPFEWNSSGRPYIEPFEDAWDLDAKTGTITRFARSTFNVAQNAKVSGNTKIEDCAKCPGGKIANGVGGSANATVTFSGVRSPNGAAGKVWAGIYYNHADKYPKYRNAFVRVTGTSTQDVEVNFAPGGSVDSGLQSSPVMLDLKAGDNDVTISNAQGSGPNVGYLVVY
ncbi:Arabinanase/levansucrase/invertase, partial [Ceraceosorus guamensis]